MMDDLDIFLLSPCHEDACITYGNSVFTVELGAGVYYLVVVLKARRDMPEIVAAALGSELMVLEVEDLTPRQLEILLKVQDPRFFDHKGIDLRSPGAGWTTITQGLVKIHYFDPFT